MRFPLPEVELQKLKGRYLLVRDDEILKVSRRPIMFLRARQEGDHVVRIDRKQVEPVFVKAVR